jgi:hypothetical protein
MKVGGLWVGMAAVTLHFSPFALRHALVNVTGSGYIMGSLMSPYDGDAL